MFDHHAHPFDLTRQPLDPTRIGVDLQDMDDRRRHAPVQPDTVWRALFMSRLARWWGVETTDVARVRHQWAADYASHVRRVFAAAAIDELIIDPSWPPGSEQHVHELAELSGCPVHLLWRVETLVDPLLAQGAGVDDILARVDQEASAALERGVRGFKSAIAYRSGLAVEPSVTRDGAAAALDGDQGDTKPLRDLVLRRLLGHAADSGLPVQIHTGFGDSDLRLTAANPLWLEPLLDTPEGKTPSVVLLHSGFPFQDEASYLAAARRNVSVDLSLVNLLAPGNLVDGVLRVLGTAPIDRVLFSTDAYVLPEAFWFAATILAEAWHEARGRLGDLGMDPGWLDQAEAAVFADNARRLYAR
jgi:predicted TIM-barrel fold metal-dependent hydrolase